MNISRLGAFAAVIVLTTAPGAAADTILVTNGALALNPVVGVEAEMAADPAAAGEGQQRRDGGLDITLLNLSAKLDGGRWDPGGLAAVGRLLLDRPGVLGIPFHINEVISASAPERGVGVSPLINVGATLPSNTAVATLLVVAAVHMSGDAGGNSPLGLSVAIAAVTSGGLGAGGVGAGGFANVDGDSPSATPEPASLLLLGTGLAGLAARRARRRQTNAEHHA